MVPRALRDLEACHRFVWPQGLGGAVGGGGRSQESTVSPKCDMQKLTVDG